MVNLFRGYTEGFLLDSHPLTRYGGTGDIDLEHHHECMSELIGMLVSEVEGSQNKDAAVVQHLLKFARSSNEASEESIKATFVPLIVAGVSTTANTLYSLINTLLHNPSVYRKLLHELDSVLGDRHVTLNDREHLPYLMATLNEILRYSSILPFLLPHATVTDTEIDGRRVPAKTLVFVNVWGLHHDPDVYTDPWEFKPERFLDTDGKLVPADHRARLNMYAFGAGPRECLGEVIGRAMLFLITASLLQKFEFEAGDLKSSCDPRDYISGTVPLFQSPYTVRAHIR